MAPSTEQLTEDFVYAGCEHRNKEGRLTWAFVSEESCIGNEHPFKVTTQICIKCASIRVVGYRGKNHFDEIIDVHHPDHVALIIKLCNHLNEKEYFVSALKLHQAEQYIEQLKEVLRFASCPEFIIENPTFIKGKKPTDEDTQWAMQKVQEHLTYEQEWKKKLEQAEQENERMRESLELICEKLGPISGPTEDYVVTDIYKIAKRGLKKPKKH